jgi:hypothetical protein
MFAMQAAGRVAGVFRSRSFRIGGRLDVVRLRPGPPLRGSETTAMPPALFSVPAATGMILAGEGLAQVSLGIRRQGETDYPGQIGDSGDANEKLPSQASSHRIPPPHNHDGFRPFPNYFSRREPFYDAVFAKSRILQEQEGDEPFYKVLHQALAKYDVAAHGQQVARK